MLKEMLMEIVGKARRDIFITKAEVRVQKGKVNNRREWHNNMLTLSYTNNSYAKANDNASIKVFLLQLFVILHVLHISTI